MDKASSPTAAGRRETTKLRHRHAIVEAASLLIEEHGGAAFTVDELAARADVARRTVFNHFPSLDEVVLEVAEEGLSTFTETISSSIASGTKTGIDGVLDDLRAVLRTEESRAAIRKLAQMFESIDEADPRRRARVNEIFARTTAKFSDLVSARCLGTSELQVVLFINAFAGGMATICIRWLSQPDTGDNVPTQLWEQMLDELMQALRHGYLRPPGTT